MKRPEVADVDHPDLLIDDAYRKALARGFDFYVTCNFCDAALWRTEDGPHPRAPVLRLALADGLAHSGDARERREEIEQGWCEFVDRVERELLELREEVAARRAELPPQVEDLREAIKEAAQEATPRIRAKLETDARFRDLVTDTFAHQFGMGLALDSSSRPERLTYEVEQVATIASFVVATRLLLYKALARGRTATGGHRHLDPLSISQRTTDPVRVRNEFAALLEHARRRTGDFELQLTPTFLDEVAFTESPEPAEVGRPWAKLLDVINRSDWSGPGEYVPGLYESLLDDAHRHASGVHYTPDAVAEVLVAYGVQEAADVVLDPACGGGTFVTMAYQRKRRLGASHDEALEETYGVEIADFAASLTALGLSLADRGAPAAYPRVIHSDFFDLWPGEKSDLELPAYGIIAVPRRVNAVIGNPPYIRFESRSPEDRVKIHDVLARHSSKEGVQYPDFTGKADIYAFFVAHAASFLNEGDRLAFVLSWSLLCTAYGDALLAFLAKYFRVEAIIDSKVERFFAAKQNVVLLLARKAPLPDPKANAPGNPNIDPGSPVRLVRMKRPLERLLNLDAPRGSRAEDVVDDILGSNEDSSDDPRWDVRIAQQRHLWERAEPTEEEDADENGE